MGRNGWLVASGLLSAAGAVLHVAVIVGGPGWYGFFGIIGEAMARSAEAGSALPPAIAASTAGILFVWALYAFSGAGLVRPMPRLRAALVLISAIYLLRGFALLPALVLTPELIDAFAVWSSLIVLGFGLAHAVGTRRAWPELATPGTGVAAQRVRLPGGAHSLPNATPFQPQPAASAAEISGSFNSLVSKL